MGVSNNITAVLNFIAILASIPIIASGIWLASKPDNECISNFRWPVVIIGILILLVSLAGFVGAYWNKQGLLALYLFCMALLIALLLFLLVFAFVVTRPDGSYDVPGRAYKEYRLDGFSSWLRNHVTSSGSWQKIRTCLAASDVCIKLTQNYITADQFFTSHISPLQNSPERHEPVASLPNEPRNPSPPPPSSIFIHLVPPCRSAAPVHFCITNAVTVQPRRFSSSATALRRFSSSATALRRFCSSATALHRFWTEMGTVGTGTNETEVASTPTPITRSTSTPQTQNPISTDDVQQTTEAPPQFVEAPTQNVPSTQVTETGTKRKSTRLTSTAWEHFKRESDKAVCNYCGKEYACNSVNHGTTNLLKHLKVCPKNPHREHDKKQKTIVLDKKDEDDKIVSLKLAEFKQDLCRDELARMIVTDELPFKFVENVGFKRFMSVSQPRFKIPGRLTIARDCMQLFREEKVKLRSFLSLNNQMVSMTTDTWTSIQNMNYMCVTAHYIDEGWELNKKILSFGLIADHKGDTIGKALEYCLKDYGISKVCTVTVDNASANNLAIAYLIRNMSAWNGTTLMNGEYMHMRCCAHILNLIVNDGLKEIDESIIRIRAACKYVRASPARLACFKKCVQDANISSSQMLVLDVPTRWNSTYLMLEVAEKYEKAFYRLESDDPFYVNNLDESGGPPNSDDWIRARLYMKFLKIFYEATLSFSSSLHVSANTFIRKFVKIQTALNSFIESDDFGLQRVASNMKKKLDKYWDVDGQMNYLLFVAVFLDPRLKLEYFEFSFPMIYGNEKCKEIMKKVMNLVKNLFAQYKGMYPYVPDSLDSSGASSDVSHVTSSNVSTNVDKVDVDDEYNISVRKKKGELKKNELDRYIEDGVEIDHDGFDILRWWRVKGHAYYILSHMARDILAIPVSTVSSESAFSTGGRVLDPYRSSLHATTVEALICTQNWLKPSTKTSIIDPQKPIDVVQVETEMSGVTLVEEKEILSDMGN